MDKYIKYSVGGFALSGRIVGQDGFYTFSDAKEYFNFKKGMPGLASLSIYGWLNDDEFEELENFVS